MRLAVVVSGFPRRSETFALNELLALDRAGCLAALFATKPGESGPSQPGASRLTSKLRVLAPGTVDRQAAQVAADLRGERISGVHGYFAHRPAEVAVAAARRLGVPYGFSVHALDARRAGPDGLARRAAHAACVIACNADVAGEARAAGASVTLIPHGVDLGRFGSAPSPPASELRLLAVGRLVEKKGFTILVDAVARLSIPVGLRIVGAGPERAALRRRILAAGLSGRVELTGPLTHAALGTEYRAAHVVVVPAIADSTGDRDGLPNVVLESMACGRPVVASRIGAMAGAVVDGRTGTLVEPGDADALASALAALARRPELRGRMGSEGRARVEREFDLHACTARLRERLEAAYA